MSVVLCKARAEGGGMVCHRCKYVWDLGKAEPPRCLTDSELRNDPLKPIIAEMAAQPR